MKTVYLDMDGVIVDFLGGIGKIYGTSHDCYKYGDEEGAMGLMCGGSKSLFWKGHGATVGWWESLEPTDDAFQIMEMVEQAVGDNVMCVTSCSGMGSAFTGKLLWLRRYFPKLEKGMITASEKWRIGHRDAILIDDRQCVVDDFRKLSGGHGILLPRKWNRHYSLESLSYLKQTLGTILLGSIQ